MAAGDRPDLHAGRFKSSNPAANAFQRWITASVKSQRGKVFVTEEKKSEMRRRSHLSKGNNSTLCSVIVVIRFTAFPSQTSAHDYLL